MTEGSGTENEWLNGIGTIGILTNNKLDKIKFDSFSSTNQRYMLGTINNVWVYVQNREGDIVLNSLTGEINSVSDINAKNLVHIKRFVFYDEDEDGKGDIHTLGVVVWQ